MTQRSSDRDPTNTPEEIGESSGIRNAIERLFTIYEEAIRPPIFRTDRDGEISELVIRIRRGWKSQFNSEVPVNIWNSGNAVRLAYQTPGLTVRNAAESIRSLRDDLLVELELATSPQPPGVASITDEVSDRPTREMESTGSLHHPRESHAESEESELNIYGLTFDLEENQVFRKQVSPEPVDLQPQQIKLLFAVADRMRENKRFATRELYRHLFGSEPPKTIPNTFYQLPKEVNKLIWPRLKVRVKGDHSRGYKITDEPSPQKNTGDKDGQ